MTLYEFRSLNEELQAEAVWDGVFLEVRADNTCNILLYDLGGFYVEVYYSPSCNGIIKLRPFRSVKPLEPYLDQLNNEELHNLFKF